MASSRDFIVRSERVGMRKYRDEDLDAFHAMNSDPAVMEFFPEPLSREVCLDYMSRINAKIDEQGYGFFAAEHLESGELMGLLGLTKVSYETEFTPAVEIGWRLAKKFWGKGLATEGARECMKWAFETTDLVEIVSMTSLINVRSFSVMERLGMSRDIEFDHPKVEPGHKLERHILYRISREQFLELE